MKLATLKNGSRDGRLVIVSRDLTRAVDAAGIAPTLQSALDHWARYEGALRSLADALEAGRAPGAFAFDPAQAMAPLPRAHQFVDASAFLNHGNIMERAFNLTVKRPEGVPILVQRQADDFRGACDDFAFPSEGDNCDYEGEFGVIVDDIDAGSTAQRCEQAIRLVVMLDDVSMRRFVIPEMQMGFGFINAKPATVFAPVAVTPDELGDAWQQGRIHLDLRVTRNRELVGHPNGAEMDWSFGQLLAHLAYNRNLRAGTVLGSGTVSNRLAEQVGSACLAEVRALETIARGQPTTAWLRYGERMRFEALDAQGRSVFGAIDHRFVAAAAR
jgi:fumarylacetoacetate (FAA) hydrolase